MLGGESARKFLRSLESIVRCLLIIASRLRGEDENGDALGEDVRKFDVLYIRCRDRGAGAA